MLKIRIIPVLLLRGNSVVKPVGFQQDRVVGDAIASVKVFSKRFADEMIIMKDWSMMAAPTRPMPMSKKTASMQLSIRS